MSILIEEIADYLEAQAIGTKTTNIFITRMPETPDNCIAIVDTGGIEPDKELPLRKKTVQILVRNTNYETGYDKAEDIFDLFHQVGDTFSLGVSTTDIMQIMALQEVTPLGQDDGGRYLFTCNYVIEYRE